LNKDSGLAQWSLLNIDKGPIAPTPRTPDKFPNKSKKGLGRARTSPDCRPQRVKIGGKKTGKGGCMKTLL